MYDLLPFPHITANNVGELRAETNDYLLRFKEALEFILQNIGVDNLSTDLVDKLNSLGTELEKNTEEANEQLQQVSNSALTIPDVVNSRVFEMAVNNEIAKIKFHINFETGNLEYQHKE